jgi:hypothetical protein
VGVDLLHRRTGTVAWGSADLREEDSHIRARAHRTTSLRLVAGKRFLGYGITAGVSRDWYSADVDATLRNASLLNPEGVLVLQEAGFTQQRTALFGNASVTLLVLNLAAEAGWQRGGSAPVGPTERLRQGGLFGGVAVRFTI